MACLGQSREDFYYRHFQCHMGRNAGALCGQGQHGQYRHFQRRDHYASVVFDNTLSAASAKLIRQLLGKKTDKKKDMLK